MLINKLHLFLSNTAITFSVNWCKRVSLLSWLFTCAAKESGRVPGKISLCRALGDYGWRLPPAAKLAQREWRLQCRQTFCYCPRFQVSLYKTWTYAMYVQYKRLSKVFDLIFQGITRALYRFNKGNKEQKWRTAFPEQHLAESHHH